jgi:hypothetical protein
MTSLDGSEQLVHHEGLSEQKKWLIKKMPLLRETEITAGLGCGSSCDQWWEFSCPCRRMIEDVLDIPLPAAQENTI